MKCVTQGRATALILIALVLPACVPIPLGSDPSVDVTLIDSSTHRPIADREVTVASVDEPDKFSRTRTDGNGHLRVGGIVRHYKCLFGEACDPVFSGAAVRISAQGYATQDFPITPYQLTHSTIPLAGEVELRRASLPP